MNKNTISDLLQALEHTTELVTRLALVADLLVQAQLRGEAIDRVILEDYSKQLNAVRVQQRELQHAIGRWWALVGRGRQSQQ